MSKAIVSITVPAELVQQLDARAESEYQSIDAGYRLRTYRNTGVSQSARLTD